MIITFINDGFRNLSATQASKIAMMIDAKVTIQTYYDVITCNSVPTDLLKTNMIIDCIGNFQTLDLS